MQGQNRIEHCDSPIIFSFRSPNHGLRLLVARDSYLGLVCEIWLDSEVIQSGLEYISHKLYSYCLVESHNRILILLMYVFFFGDEVTKMLLKTKLR